MPIVSELLRLLLKDGWFLYRNGSRHDLYRHPTKKGQIAVPRHKAKELANGTFTNILKDAGLR